MLEVWLKRRVVPFRLPHHGLASRIGSKRTDVVALPGLARDRCQDSSGLGCDLARVDVGEELTERGDVARLADRPVEGAGGQAASVAIASDDASVGVLGVAAEVSSDTACWRVLTPPGTGSGL